MWIFIFLLGLSVGSFINVLVDRLPKNESIVKKRSHCDSCKKTLGFLDLIPVLSFTVLKRKCRHCHSPISLQYPMVELLTGFLFVLAFLFFKSENLSFIIYHLSLVSVLIAIFFIDLKHGIIPDKLIYPATVLTFIYLILNTQFLILNHLFSALGAFLFFLLLVLLSRGKGMGLGDVKLVFLMGLLLGFPKIIVALYVAFLTGAILGIILIVWQKKRLRGSTIAFGPFLVFGTFIALFFGEILLGKIAGGLHSLN